jgi:hypothetical protein
VNNKIEVGDLVCDMSDPQGKRGTVKIEGIDGYPHLVSFDDCVFMDLHRHENDLLLIEKRPKELVT